MSTTKTKTASNTSPTPTKEEMDAVLGLCRNNHWTSCLQCLQRNPQIGESIMTMNNNINTTIIHQAITSKGEIRKRASVILRVLATTPQAAKIKNGYGSLPLHVLCQRNTKIDSKTKEQLLNALIRAYPEALWEQGGVSRRTPLHIIFTDYVSPSITALMLSTGKRAAKIKDKNGYLPAHIAATRHVSPDKLKMLLNANPDSIFARTDGGSTMLSLAQSSATPSHPNYRLIEALKKAMRQSGRNATELDVASIVPARVSSGDASDSSKSNDEPKVTITKKKRKPRKKADKRSAKRVKVKQEVLETIPTASSNFDTPGAADLLLHFATANPQNNPNEVEVTQHEGAIVEV